MSVFLSDALNLTNSVRIFTGSDSSATFYGVSPAISFYLVAIANASSSIGKWPPWSANMQPKVI